MWPVFANPELLCLKNRPQGTRWIQWTLISLRSLYSNTSKRTFFPRWKSVRSVNFQTQSNCFLFALLPPTVHKSLDTERIKVHKMQPMVKSLWIFTFMWLTFAPSLRMGQMDFSKQTHGKRWTFFVYVYFLGWISPNCASSFTAFIQMLACFLLFFN